MHRYMCVCLSACMCLCEACSALLLVERANRKEAASCLSLGQRSWVPGCTGMGSSSQAGRIPSNTS